MANALFASLQGKALSVELGLDTARYARNLLVNPWNDNADQRTIAHAQRFFEAVAGMGKTTDLVPRWSRAFDTSGDVISDTLASAFITAFFRMLYHQPRTYYAFACHRRSAVAAGVMDFVVEYPIATEFWTIYVSVSGTGVLSVGEKNILLPEGAIVLVPPACECSISRSAESIEWQHDCLSFKSRLEWVELLLWAESLTQPVCLRLDCNHEFSVLCRQFEELERTPYAPGMLSERLCHNLIESILIRVKMYAGDDYAVCNIKVQRAVDFVLHNFQENHSLASIASKVGSSASRLNALFQQHFGISIIKWRDQVRMQKARELLLHSHEKVGDIGLLIGYDDALYFSRRFKQHFGMAPTAFRAKNAMTEKGAE